MNRNQRIALLAGAVVVAVAAFLILRPGEAEEPAREASSTTPAQTSSDNAEDDGTTTEAPPPKPKPEFTRIQVKGGQPVGGEAKVEVTKGETIRLAVNSDVADEVHVHGYDLSREIAPGQPVRMRFKATLEGVFEVELEQRAVPIAQLEVRP
jgi:hypothetical protein